MADANHKELTEVAKAAATEAAQDALAELVGDGLSQAEAQGLLVDVLDQILAWRLIVGEPFASILEARDGPAIQETLNLLAKALHPDPAKIEARAQRAQDRGHTKTAERRWARAARAQARQSGESDA